jgi:hypothetical protein
MDCFKDCLSKKTKVEPKLEKSIPKQESFEVKEGIKVATSDIEENIKKESSALKKFYCDNTNLGMYVIVNALQKYCPNLEELSMANCHIVSSTYSLFRGNTNYIIPTPKDFLMSFELLCKKCKKLKYINFGSAPDFNEENRKLLFNIVKKYFSKNLIFQIDNPHYRKQLT